MKEVFAPIVVFVYNRPNHVVRLLNSLMKAEYSGEATIIVYSDGYKGDNDIENVMRVRACLSEYTDKFGSMDIRLRSKNLGLADSIISGVTEVLKEYDSIIVLEDDLEVSVDFITYMNDGLRYYENDLRYGMISAYTSDHRYLDTYKRDVYCLERGDCWGWATWRDRWCLADWSLLDFDEYLEDRDRRDRFSALQYGLEDQLINQHNRTIDAWAARWIFSLFNEHMLTVYPRVCRCINTGFDGSGVNCGYNKDSVHRNTLNESNDRCRFEKLSANYTIQRLQYDFGLERTGRMKAFVNNLRYKGYEIKKAVIAKRGALRIQSNK